MTEAERAWRVVPKQTWQRMLGLGRLLDLNKGGYYDARSGAINFWCGPDNKPPSWKDVEITQGALAHPRSYVGEVSGLYVPLDYQMVRLTLSVSPYDRAEDQLSRKQWGMGKWDAIRAGHHPRSLRYGLEGHKAMKPLPDEWEWVEKQAQELLTIAERIIEEESK